MRLIYRVKVFQKNAIMKRLIFILSFFLSGIITINSQELAYKQDIDYINSLLKENPYKDTFLEIVFFYSIDITPSRELIVKMDFNGPFRTIFKAKIADLNTTLQIDTALEGTSSVCWYCKTDQSNKETSCVYSESITTEGENESHYSDNICVMISRKNEIRNKLITAFGNLFKKILEQ